MLLTLQVTTRVGMEGVVDVNGFAGSDEWGILHGS